MNEKKTNETVKTIDMSRKNLNVIYIL